MPEKTFKEKLSEKELPQDDMIPIKYKEQNEIGVAKLAETAKTRLQEMFEKRFPQMTRQLLGLSAIFDPSEKLKKSSENKHVALLIERYKDDLKKSKILVKAEFQKFLRVKAKAPTKAALRRIVQEKIRLDQSWCESVLIIQSKLQAI